MQFKVIGAIKETGQDVEVIVEAMSIKEAEKQAHQLGILVSLVSPVTDDAPSNAIGHHVSSSQGESAGPLPHGSICSQPVTPTNSIPKKQDAELNRITGIVVAVLLLSCCCGSPLLVIFDIATPPVKTQYEQDITEGESEWFYLSYKWGLETPTRGEALKYGRIFADQKERERREAYRIKHALKRLEKLGTESPKSDEGQ